MCIQNATPIERPDISTNARLNRTRLLASAAVCLVLTAPFAPAFAASGGAGGPGGAGNPAGGSGGAGGSNGPGASGASTVGAAGGSGGTVVGGDGTAGGNGGAALDTAAGGGGGGGGLNGTATSGGNGGAGGVGGDAIASAGGGGGGGGGGDAIYNATINNSGALVSMGGAGGQGGQGGGALANAGSGGAGGNGGSGARLSGSGLAVSNSGALAILSGSGGQGGNGGKALTIGGSGGAGGSGGLGASVSGRGAMISNTAATAFAIVAGGGGRGGAGGGALANGGAGGVGGSGGAAAALSGRGARISNASLMAIVSGAGGQGGAGGMALSQGGAGGAGGAGGLGLSVSGMGATISNAGTLTFASGAGGQGGDGGTALGADGSGGTGGRGGDGVSLSGRGATITNAGAFGIIAGNGGQGGAGGAGGTGGAGGDALIFAGRQASAFLGANTAAIGGDGGDGGAGSASSGAGGDGGVAIRFKSAGAKLINAGAAIGGSGGAGGTGAIAGRDGAGGIGIVANGITIANTGLIAGGFDLAGNEAFAIRFVGGRNFVGGSGVIAGGIDVQGASWFTPALPRSAIGTPLAVIGPLRFAQTATYSIRIAGGATDSVVADAAKGPSGTATLRGAKVFVQTPRALPVRGMRYTIVTAGNGVVGRFQPTVGSDLAFFKPTLSYDATHVYLRADYSYTLPGLTLNQQHVAAGLQNASQSSQGPRGQQLLNGLNAVRTGQAPAVLDSLSGEGITATQSLAHRATSLFTSSIFDQTTFYGTGGVANAITLTEPQPAFVALAAQQGQPIRELADLPARDAEPTMPALSPNRTWRAWATGYGADEHMSGNALPIGSASQSSTLYGGTLGVDYQLTPNYLVGVAVGGSDGDFRVAQRATSGSTTGGHVALYDIYTLGAWYGASSTSFSYFSNRTTRFVGGFGGLGNETERGSFNSYDFRSRLEIGRHFESFGGVLTPFVALEIADLRSNGFQETTVSGPGLFALNVAGRDTADVPAFVGLRLQRATSLGNGMVLSPTLQVAYLHEFAPYRQQTAQLADLPGSTFLVDGARPSYNAAQVKAGAELSIGRHAAIFANFEGEFSGVDRLYAGKGGLKYIW